MPAGLRGFVLRLKAPAAVLVAAAVLGSGCAGRAYQVERVIDGEPRRGAFVAPSSYEAFLRAELAVAQGDDAAAVEHYRSARAGVADDPLLAARQGAAQLRLGRSSQAASTIEQGLALDPEHEELLWVAAALAETQGDRGRALSLLSQAYHRYRSVPSVLRLVRFLQAEQPARALALLETELDARPNADAAALTLRYHWALLRRDARALSLAATALLQRQPLRAQELRDGVALLLAERRPMVAARLAEALGAHRDASPEDIALEVQALIAAGERSLARERVFSLSPEQAGGEAKLAFLCLRVGERSRAQTLARIALALHQPGAAEVLSALDADELDGALPPEGFEGEALRQWLLREGLQGLAGEVQAL